MALRVSYRAPGATAVLQREDDVASTAWAELQRIGRERGAVSATAAEIEVPWLGFLSLLQTIRHLQSQHGFTLEYDAEARARIAAHIADAKDLRTAQRGEELPAISAGELYERLISGGWDVGKRELTDEQLVNVTRMLQLRNGANFSVPGAGKTTVELAVHLAGMGRDAKMLVVAPNNAMAAWDEVLADCLADGYEPFVRLTGGEAAIRQALLDEPSRAIIGYAQLIRAETPIVEFLGRHAGNVHLVLDESHRIKAGSGAVTGAAALRLGPLAVRRDILSGTPMPQSVNDLAPQFDFLWPAHGIGRQLLTQATVRETVMPLYVRTTKEQLGLDDPIIDYLTVEMSNPQRLLYGLLRDDVLRAAAGIAPHELPFRSRAPVLRLLQAAVDPQIAVASMVNSGFTLAHTDFALVCRAVVEEDWSPRMAQAEQIARELAAGGQKTVVWTPFVGTIRRLAERLSDLGAVMIYGGVAAGDEDDATTREGIIKRFHDDPDCMVLVANPAAGGEGISLHKVCHNAVYVGRTYNAAHYMQSQDRIHRLGLAPGVETHVHVLETSAPARLGSIDRSVRRRLNDKINAMSDVLNDPGLRVLTLEPEDGDALDDNLSVDDLRDLLTELRGTETDERVS